MQARLVSVEDAYESLFKARFLNIYRGDSHMAC